MKRVMHRHEHTIKNITKFFKEKKTIGFKNMPRNVHVFFDTKPDREIVLIPRTVEDYGRDFLLQVATCNPDFKFFIKVAGGADDYTYLIRQVYVFDKDEAVGLIEYEGSGIYSFYNSRIYDVIRRGSNKKTSKLKLAIKIFKEFFYGRTLAEEMAHVKDSIDSAMRTNRWNVSQERDSTVNKLQGILKEKFIKQDVEFLNFLRNTGQGDLEEKYKEAALNAEVTEQLEQHMGQYEGAYVLIKDDTYCFFTPQKGPHPSTVTKRVPRSELSPATRTALGLLKVAEQDTAIAGVGFRISSNEFYILKE